MGSLALKDLNEKHSLKPQTLPLTQDIILFKDYCYKIADEALENLKKNLKDLESFQKLSEATLVLTVLINRKKVGDVQYMKLRSYESVVNSNKEDCLNILTDAEKELTKHFKRVITVGKGSKPVPILFPKRVQEFVDMMLLVRKTTTVVPKENPFFICLGRKLD
ncbi:hypothetical protein NQ314_011815 [Rhamnusium bicolor]|uniref:Uncharacterized protein n=1 Tax=Rhamnusium bicolor TaxID=1586634 RepID=A0AAV8XEY6_9CUCU|nr:hypothetical protein NQ314_011815 [Rhamnusium bicolor]